MYIQCKCELPPSPSQAPSDHHNALSGMWGRLSCYILVADWDSALEELNSLRKHIDDSVSLTFHVCACVCVCVHVRACVWMHIHVHCTCHCAIVPLYMYNCMCMVRACTYMYIRRAYLP